ncbi:MAG: MFS transporter [Pseudomonadota bacterium]
MSLPCAHLLILVIGFLVLFVGGGSRFAIGLVLKPMAADLDWNRSVLGGAAGLFLAVSAAFMFVSGKLADRFSLPAVLGTGLIVAGLGIGAMAWVTAPWQALVLYGVIFAIGNGIASIAPVGVMVSRQFPGRMGFANAVTVSGTGIGQLLIIGGLAAYLADIGWRSSFLVLAVVTIALLPVVWFALPAPDQKTGGSTASAAGLNLREAARTRQFWLLIVVYAICGFQDFFVATHIAAFAEDEGLSRLFAGNLLALMGLAGVIGVLGAGAWSDAGGPKAPTLFCFALRFGLFAVIMLDQSHVTIAAFALLFGSTVWITAPLTVIFVRDSFGNSNLGALSGLIVMIHHMCGGLGAFVGAVAFDLQGHYGAMFALMLAVSVIGAVLTLMLARPD